MNIESNTHREHLKQVDYQRGESMQNAPLIFTEQKTLSKSFVG